LFFVIFKGLIKWSLIIASLALSIIGPFAVSLYLGMYIFLSLYLITIPIGLALLIQVLTPAEDSSNPVKEGEGK